MIFLTICAWTVKCIFCVFLEYSNANKSFLVFPIYGCSALGFHQWLYQVFFFVHSFQFDVIVAYLTFFVFEFMLYRPFFCCKQHKIYILPVLNTRLVLIDHFSLLKNIFSKFFYSKIFLINSTVSIYNLTIYILYAIAFWRDARHISYAKVKQDVLKRGNLRHPIFSCWKR